MKTVKIGNGAGFWGDSLDAPHRLAEAGRLDYLTLEYLAELTMSILAYQKSRDPQAGYVTDFPTVVQSLIGALKAQPNLKIVTNAGGINPLGCAASVGRLLADEGLSDVAIGVVTGDDLLPVLDDLLAAGETFDNLQTGEPLGARRTRTVCANAYLGADGIVQALSAGARIVVTGRVADASLTVGPALFEFGWDGRQWDLLAAATVAGHLIECGAQVTGGMYSDWTEQMSLADVGYPVAELAADGSLIITKPEGTGGAVTVGTVSEQLVYEIGDPAHYLTPDVDADFSRVQLSQRGPDRVAVTGASGRPPPERFKVSLAYRDGYTVSGTLVVCGPDAPMKARYCGELIVQRVRQAGFDLQRVNIEALGAGDSLPGLWRRPAQPAEAVLRLSAHDPRREAVERLAREFAPLVTSGPPGVTGYTGGRPKPHPVFAFWPTTVARDRVPMDVTVKTAAEWSG